MELTGRRKQFLQKLIDLYNKTNLPVHYVTLAKALGVSKWTAYDMLKELEKLGYLTRDYEVNPGETGRSQIVFRPAERGIEMMEASHGEAPRGRDDMQPEEWRRIKSRVISFLNSVRKCSISEAMQKAADELPNVHARVDFCAHVIGLLLVYLNKLGGTGESAIKNLIRNAPTSEMRMSMLAGAVTGTIMKTANREVTAKITDWVERCLAAINELSDRERGMLSDFLNEALA